MKDRAIGVDGVASTLGAISKKGTEPVVERQLVDGLAARFHVETSDAEQAVRQATDAGVITVTDAEVKFNRD